MVRGCRHHGLREATRRLGLICTLVLVASSSHARRWHRAATPSRREIDNQTGLAMAEAINHNVTRQSFTLAAYDTEIDNQTDMTMTRGNPQLCLKVK